MKNALVKCFIVLAALISSAAFADGSYIQIPADLMIHPAQTAQFFQAAADKINSAPNWQWANLEFAQPYHTTWSNVQAVGPFQMQFSTSNLNRQELDFDFSWANPSIQVGQFEVHDTIERDESGVHLIIHLDGSCSNMTVQVPSGQWHMHGKLLWDLKSKAFVLNWGDYQFTMSAAKPQINLGQCSGPAELQQGVLQSLQTMMADQSWLSDVLKQGIMDWGQSNLQKLSGQLLMPQTVSLNENLGLTWTPQDLVPVAGGLIRVPGQFQLLRVNSNVKPVTLTRSYDDTTLSGVTESGFILPKDTLPQLVRYLYQTGDLRYRVNSSSVSSFSSLMGSRFFQFFVWPDLMKFPSNTQFWFDVSAESAPTLTDGAMNQGGGIAYSVSAPLLVNQWAPGNSAYVPYVDFRTPMAGEMTAKIDDGGKLSIQLAPGELNVSATYRPEFSKVRRVDNNWISTGILGSNVKSYLEDQNFQFALPTWDLGQGMSLSMRDLQIWHQSFRIPLQVNGLTP